jgi:ElaB/YqjD/DUF883 family membrane-anchored ribosome-binding protein
MTDSTRNTESTRPTEKLRDKISETRDNVVDMGHLAKEAVQDKLHELKESAADKYGAGKEKLAEYGEDFADTVRGAPMKSVLIAAGVGLLVGFFACRR